MSARLSRLLGTLVCIGALIVVPDALAEGGQTIAGAPTIVFGQQEFGNLNNGAVTQNSCSGSVYTEWWLLPVTSGDQVAINWEAQELQYTAIEIYPVGTTDYTYPNTQPAVDEELNANNKAQATLTANLSGTMPVAFKSSDYNCLNGTPGPYDFTAYVTHALILSLPALSGSLSGTVAIGIHNPDGAPLSGPPLSVDLQVYRNGMPWSTVGTATPANGTATITYQIPVALAGSKVRFRALATGSGYQTTASNTETITLSSIPPACVVPQLIHLRIQTAKADIRQASCTLGTVQRRHSRRINRGRVIAQSPRPGVRLPHDAQISLTIGR